MSTTTIRQPTPPCRQEKIIRNLFKRSIRWRDLTNVEKRVLADKFNTDLLDNVILRHENPYIHQRIDENVPFTIKCMQYPYGEDDKEIHLLLMPDYSGSGRRMTKEKLLQTASDLLPILLPDDTIINFNNC